MVLVVCMALSYRVFENDTIYKNGNLRSFLSLSDFCKPIDLHVKAQKLSMHRGDMSIKHIVGCPNITAFTRFSLIFDFYFARENVNAAAS